MRFCRLNFSYIFWFDQLQLSLSLKNNHHLFVTSGFIIDMGMIKNTCPILTKHFLSLLPLNSYIISFTEKNDDERKLEYIYNWDFILDIRCYCKRFMIIRIDEHVTALRWNNQTIVSRLYSKCIFSFRSSFNDNWSLINKWSNQTMVVFYNKHSYFLRSSFNDKVTNLQQVTRQFYWV